MKNLEHSFIFADFEFLNVTYLDVYGNVLDAVMIAGHLDAIKIDLRGMP